jgi:hypothetical protein
MGTCDCSLFKVNQALPGQTFATDDLILHPAMPGQAYQQKRFGPATGATGYSRASRVNFNNILQNQLLPQNNQFNCEMIKRGGSPSSSNAIVTEIFYDQPQLFGFPFVSNPFTDPVPLYSHTVMRIVDASRGELTTNIDTLGPICLAYPFAVKSTTVPVTTTPNTIIPDIVDGPGGSDKGFLSWNTGQTASATFLEQEVDYPQLSLTQYGGGTDYLSPGDSVRSSTASYTNLNAGGRLDDLVGQAIVIPVWSSFSSGNYVIQRFITVRLTRNQASGGINLGSNPIIEAQYLGEATACNTN